MSVITRSSRGNPWIYRSLIWNFAQRDLKSRFRGTLLGWLWSLMLPLATLVIYTAVFSVIFRAQPPAFGNGREGIYAVWLLVGMVSYNFFSIGVNLAMSSMLDTGSLMQKIYIPSYIPVIGAVIASSIQTLIEFAILAVILIALLNVGWTWLLFPVLALMFFVFVVAVGYSLAVWNVYMRDLQQIIAVVIQLLFFLSPILYPAEQIPEEWHGVPIRVLMSINPIAEFIVAFRNALYDLTMPSLTQFAAMAAWTLGALLVAVIVHKRRGQDIGEAI